MQPSNPSLAWLKTQRPLVRASVGCAIGLGMSSGVLLIVQAALLAHLAAAVIFGHAGLEKLWPPLLMLLAIICLRAALAYAMERASFAAASAIKLSVRHRLMTHLTSLGIVWQRSVQTGEVVNTVTDGVESLEAYYGRYLPQTALAMLIPLAILVVIFPIDWMSALILLLTAPLIPVFMVFIGKGAEALNQRQWQRMGLLSGHFLDALRGLTTLKIFNMGRREARLIARLSEDYRSSTMAVLRLAFLSSLVLEFLATVSIAMVAVLIGFRLLWGDIGFEAGFLVLLLAPDFYLPLRNMGSVYHARMEAIGAAERMVELLDTPVSAGTCTRFGVLTGGVPRVRVRSLNYTYPHGDTALRDIDLHIGRAGQMMAVVGPTGAGKSTLALMLLGLLRPDSGSVEVDGVALADIALESWHTKVAWVPQQPHLLFGSVRENLCLGRLNADDETLWQALRQAQAHDVVAALPRGLDTAIGERGLRLSGGEAQRLAIARALVKDAPFVVVDEVSAHLDSDNEQRLIKALSALAVGRSLVVIAHRLATVEHADHIVVMDHGRVREQGNHVALRAADGLYARLLAATAGLP